VCLQRLIADSFAIGRLWDLQAPHISSSTWEVSKQYPVTRFRSTSLIIIPFFAVTEAGPSAFANIGENYYYVFVCCTTFFLVMAYFYFP
jgi:hypothetical protein